MPTPDITLFGIKVSGHVHRVVLLLEILELPYKYIETTSQSRATPDFLALSPFGQVPVLHDGDTVVIDSNAILVYLVRRYAPESQWLPHDAVGAAKVQRWLSIAAGELRYGPALARVITRFKNAEDPEPARELSTKLFVIMDQHLADQTFLAGERPTIADLACWSYTAHAPEGGVTLDKFPHLRAWIKRVAALPKFLPMSGIETKIAG